MAGKRSVGALHATLSLKDISFKRGLQAAGKEITALGKKSAAIGKTVVTAGAGLAAAGVAGFAAFAVSSSKAAADIEDLSIQFEVLTGSAQKAKELISQFREEEKKSSLSTQDYAEAAKGLLANNVAYEDILPTLKMIGDVSMGNATRFDRVAYAMGQISSKTRLLGTETLQLQESGFNPLQQMMKMTGESYDSLLKKQEKGMISYQDVAAAMKFATSEGGLFYKAIEKGSAGTNAKINQTAAAVTQLKIAFGTGFNDGLKIALDATNNFLPQLESKFATAGQMIGSAISSAVQGDTSQLAAIGGFIGEVIFAGLKAALLKGFDELSSVFANAGNALGAELRTAFQLASGIAPDGKVGQQTEAKPMSLYMKNAMDGIQSSQNLQLLKAANATAQSLKYAQEQIAKGKESTTTSPVVAPKIEIPDVANLEINIPNAPERQIDDYQRRGLSMSKTPGSVQDKVLKVQEQIRDILKSAKMNDKQLVW